MEIIVLILLFIIILLLYLLFNQKNNINKIIERNKKNSDDNIQEIENLKKSSTENEKQLKYHIQKINSNLSQLERNERKLIVENNSLKKQHKEIESVLIKKHNLYLDIENNEKLKQTASLVYADYKLAQFTLSSKFLKNKTRPALIEAKRIDELTEKTKEIIKECRLKTYQSELIHKRNNELEQTIKEKDELFTQLKSKTSNAVSKITSLYSDFILIQYEISKNVLLHKKNPAFIEAKRISELKKESKIHVERYKEMLYKYEFLLQIFPELTDYVDDFSSLTDLSSKKDLSTVKDEFDRVKLYMNKGEYLEMSENERNQFALDNYIKGSKTNWQIGRDYELFCGYYYEEKGWDVKYYGMEKKLQDLGRDLIVKKGDETLIVQCKYWAKEKLIHEKHILQLYGTTIVEKISNEDIFYTFKPVFITNIELSKTAKQFAQILGVEVIKLKMGEFPRIKCNINFDEFGNKTKIYHLPFDQQYDRTQIKDEGEFYAYTVNEAVDKGFRRAFRYKQMGSS